MWRTGGDIHSTSLTTPHTWDASVADKQYLFKPDVRIDGDILPSDGKIRPFMTGHQWSKGHYSGGGTEDLDQNRCHTTTAGPSTGCAFVNSAPT